MRLKEIFSDNYEKKKFLKVIETTLNKYWMQIKCDKMSTINILTQIFKWEKGIVKNLLWVNHKVEEQNQW